jgi:photosystem II stability/assembly factor-like uncharacterized protein
MNPTASRRLPASFLTASLFFTAAATGVAQDAAEPADSVIAPLASSELMIDAAQIDGLIAAVGTRGIVLLSEDGGDTWTQVSVPTRSMLTGVYFHDRQRGWAVGHDAVILRTTDGGQNWERVNFDPDRETPLFDVWFADADNGLAIGAYGLVYRTTDGGQSWDEEMLEVVEAAAEEEAVEEAAEEGEAGAEDEEEAEFWEEDVDAGAGAADFHLNRIDRAQDGTLYIAAEAGNAYRSDDDGATWVSLDTGYEGSFFSTLPIGEETILAMGLQGSIFRSDDAGSSFRRVDSPVDILLNEGALLPDGRIVLVGMSGTILVSDDGAESFYVVQRADRKALTQVLPNGGEGILVFGEAGPVKIPAEDLRRQ